MLGNGRHLHSFLAYVLLRKSDICLLAILLLTHLVLPLFLWLTWTRLILERAFVERNSSPVTHSDEGSGNAASHSSSASWSYFQGQEALTKEGCRCYGRLANWELAVCLLFISFKSHSGSVVYLHLLKEHFRRVFVLQGKLGVYAWISEQRSAKIHGRKAENRCSVDLSAASLGVLLAVGVELAAHL